MKVQKSSILTLHILSVLIISVALSACGGGGGSSTTSRPTSVPNQPPVVVINAVQPTAEMSLVTLSGANSFDSDGNIASIVWTQTSGPEVSLTDGNSLSPSFVAPNTEMPIELSFTLTLTDNDGETAVSTITVTINPNIPPVANAGSDQIVIGNQSIALSASGSSDSDGVISTYLWIQLTGPTVTITNPNSVSPSFTAPAIDTQESLSFEVTVTDTALATATDSIEIIVVPNAPPELETHFPCEGCRVNSTTLTVTGIASLGIYSDTVEQPSDLSITVSAGLGSAVAIISNDGRWRAANVPIDNSSAAVEIIIEAVDSYGATSTITTNLINQPTLTSGLVFPNPLIANNYYFLETHWNCKRLLNIDTTNNNIVTLIPCDAALSSLSQITDTKIDATGNRLLMTQFSPGALYSLDLNTLNLTQLSSDPNNLLSQLLYLELNYRAIVWNNRDRSIMEINLETGEPRTLVSNTGAFDEYISSMALATEANLVFLFSSNNIIGVQLASGRILPQRSINGIKAVNPSETSYDHANHRIIQWSANEDRLYVVKNNGLGEVRSDTGTSGITTRGATASYFGTNNVILSGFSDSVLNRDTDNAVNVNTDNGERTELFGDTLGSGPQIDFGANVLFDSESNSIYVTEISLDNLIKIDLTTKNRTVISGGDIGTGTTFSSPHDLALDTSSNVMYVLESSRILAIDLETGNRSVISNALVGTGPNFSTLHGMVYDESKNRLIVIDAGIPAVMSVNISNGNREIISNNTAQGEEFIEPRGIGFNSTTNTLLVSDAGNGATTSVKLFSIDLDSGARSVTSSSIVGTGPYLSDVGDVQLLQGSSHAIVSNYNNAILVDLASGDREYIYSAEQGNGERLSNISKISIDTEKGLIYGISLDNEALFSIEIVSGDHVVVSK